MVKKLCLFLFVCVYLQTVVCQSGDPCKRTNGALGTCNYYASITDVLTKAHCGFEGKVPKVCCPVPATARTTITHIPKLISKMGVKDFVPAFLDPPVCGLSNFNAVSQHTGRSQYIDRLIIGGNDANPDDFPWLALLGYNSSRGTDWLCGGSLISSRHVLTAAHCIHNQEHKLYVVRLGGLDLSREDEGAYPIDVLIKKMVAHEEYDTNSYNNDIGVLVLQDDVQFTDAIRPICMPKGPEWRTELVGDIAFIAGWGTTSRIGERPTNLQYLHVPVLNNSVCARAYKLYKTLVIDERVLCAGFMTGGRDACQGDSGGPLMLALWSAADKEVYFYELGTITLSLGCGVPAFPGVYTSITHFLPWIEEKVLGHNTQ